MMVGAVSLVNEKEHSLNQAVEAAVNYLKQNKKGGSVPLWWVLNELGYSKEHPPIKYPEEFEKRLVEHPNIQWKWERKQREGQTDGRCYKNVRFFWHIKTVDRADVIRYREKYGIGAVGTDITAAPSRTAAVSTASSGTVHNNTNLQSNGIQKGEISMPVEGREGSNMSKLRKRISSDEAVKQALGIFEKSPNKKFSFKALEEALGYKLWQPTKLAIRDAATSHPNVNVHAQSAQGGKRALFEWVDKATVKDWAVKGSKGKKGLRAASETPAALPVPKVALPSATDGKKSAEDLIKEFWSLVSELNQKVASLSNVSEGLGEILVRTEKEKEATNAQIKDLRQVAKDKQATVKRLGQALRRADKVKATLKAVSKFARLKRN